MAQVASGASRWASRIGIAALALFIVGPLAAHVGLLPALGGFVLFDLGGLLGIVALILGGISWLRGRGGAAGVALGALVTVCFFAIAVPARRFPPINDITTDPAQPPAFVRAGSLPSNSGRNMGYPGASFAEQQQKGYPALAPLRLSAPPDQAFQRVEAAARQMPDWEITRDDAGARALEGVATSRLFRFQDDFVIEVRADGGGSVVQMRSKSRDGKGDIGANAARIQAFFAAMRH